MKKIYLAGAITGVKDYKKNFGSAQRLFESADTFVINPARMPEGETPGWYMSRLLPQLLDSDFVVLLPRWEASKGACIERALALYAGIPVVYLEDPAKP